MERFEIAEFDGQVLDLQKFIGRRILFGGTDVRKGILGNEVLCTCLGRF